MLCPPLSVCVYGSTQVCSFYLVLGRVYWAVVGSASNCWFGWPVNDTDRQRWEKVREKHICDPPALTLTHPAGKNICLQSVKHFSICHTGCCDCTRKLQKSSKSGENMQTRSKISEKINIWVWDQEVFSTTWFSRSTFDSVLNTSDTKLSYCQSREVRTGESKRFVLWGKIVEPKILTIQKKKKKWSNFYVYIFFVIDVIYPRSKT